MLPSPFIASPQELVARAIKNPSHTTPMVVRDRVCPVGQVLNADGECVPAQVDMSPAGGTSPGDTPQPGAGAGAIPPGPDGSCPPGYTMNEAGRCLPSREPDPADVPDSTVPTDDDADGEFECPPGTLMTPEGRCIPPEDVPKGDLGCPPGHVQDENGRCVPVDDPGLEDGEIPGDEVDECIESDGLLFDPRDNTLKDPEGNVQQENVELVGWTLIAGVHRAVVRAGHGVLWCVRVWKEHGKCCEACAIGAPCAGCSGGCGDGCSSCGKSEKRFAHEARFPRSCCQGGHGVKFYGKRMENPMHTVKLSSARTGVAVVPGTFNSPFVRVVGVGTGPGGTKVKIIVPRKGFAFVLASKWEGKAKAYGKFVDVKKKQAFVIVRIVKPATVLFGVTKNPDLTREDLRAISQGSRRAVEVRRPAKKNTCMAAPVANLGGIYTVRHGALFKNPMKPIFDTGTDAQHRLSGWLAR